MPVGQAQQIFVGADRVLSQNPWHHFAEEHNALAALQSISQITGEQHGRFTVVNDLAAINDVIANLDGSTVRNSEGAGWARVFDNYRTLVDANHARGTPLPEHAPRIAKNPDPINRKMREFYRAMMRGTLEVLSPTASLGKKAIAPEELSHEDVMTITYANFERTAQIVLRRAPQLSVSLRTVQEINRSLTVGLVDDSIRGKLFHGDAWFHQEVKQFYRFLETPKFRRFMRKFPVEAAHWIHYVISVQDVLPDANSRTSKMMADLILLKAGLAPAYYESMDEFFEQGGPRSSLSVQQRLNYFYRIVSRSLEFVRGEMKVQRPSTSESLKAALLSSPYHEGVAPTPESRRSLVEFMSMVHRAEPRRLQ